MSQHIYIFSTIFFTVYSQLIMRWQVSAAGVSPVGFLPKLTFIAHLFLNIWVITAIIATLLAGISWMLAMTKFEISYAYPWTALNFILMLILGVLLFNESISLQKVFGTMVVIIGLVLVAKG